MFWVYGIICMSIGLILGIVITRLTSPQHKQHQKIKKELEAAQFNLNQQRQELTDHFSKTAELMDTLGKDYTKLFQHMVNTSTELLPGLPEQDQPFIKEIAQVEATEAAEVAKDEVNTQPKDYAQGATGLLTPEEKEIIEAPDMVKPDVIEPNKTELDKVEETQK